MDAAKSLEVRKRGQGRPHWSALLLGSAWYIWLSAVLSRHRRLAAALLILIPVTWLVIWNILPLIQMFNISLLPRYPRPVGDESGLTLQHYQLMFTDRTIYNPFIRTIVFCLVVSFATLVFMMPLAYFIAKKVPANWQIRLLLLALVPSWVGELIRVFSYVLMFASNGAINLVLQWAGLIERPIPFLYTWFSLGAGVLYVTSLFMLVPLYAAIERIPNHVLEAASDLGANSFQRFFRVTLPLIRDGIATGVTLVFLISTGIYTVPTILAGSTTNLFSQVIASYFHDTNLTWSRGAALSIMLFTTALLISGVLNALIRPRRRQA